MNKLQQYGKLASVLTLILALEIYAGTGSIQSAVVAAALAVLAIVISDVCFDDVGIALTGLAFIIITSLALFACEKVPTLPLAIITVIGGMIFLYWWWRKPHPPMTV